MDTIPCLWRNPGVGVNAGGTNQTFVKAGVENFTSEVGSNSGSEVDGVSNRRVA